MIGKLKNKALFGALAILDTALLGTSVALAKRIMKKIAHQEVVNAIIKENETLKEKIVKTERQVEL